MKSATMNVKFKDLKQLCDVVRDLVLGGDYNSSIDVICKAMERFPHAPHPHNLLGIVLEKIGDHAKAMKHFQAAKALDPKYVPAMHNLHTYGTFSSSGSCAFDESDIPTPTHKRFEIVFDDRGIGHVVYKENTDYDL